MADQAISPGLATAFEPSPVQEQTLELSFDLYERYSAFEAIVQRLFSKTNALRILDVGANSPYLWPGFPSLLKTFLPDAQCTISDVEITPGLRDAAAASGLQLPFADSTFDAVCALDTLEHIPNESRQAFIDELLRVSRDILYLTFPYHSAGNLSAERVVNTYLEDVLHNPIHQLKEHRDFGLPHLSLIDGLLRSHTASVYRFEHGNVDVWLLMMLASHTLRVHSLDMLRDLNVRFNRNYAPFDWREPGYRASFLISKRGRTSDLDRAVNELRSGHRSDLGLSEVLQLVREFSEAEIAPQVLLDKDRHIHNLEAELNPLRKIVREKEQHIHNLETALQQKDRHILNVEAELAAVRKQAAITAELQFRMQKMEEAHLRSQEQQASLEARASGLEAAASGLEAGTRGLKAEITVLAQRLSSDNDDIHQALRELTLSHQRDVANLREIMRTQHERVVSRLQSQEAVTHQLLTSRTWRALQAAGNVARLILPSKAEESPVFPYLKQQPEAPQQPSPIVAGTTVEPQRTEPVADQNSVAQDSRPTPEDEVLETKEIYFFCDEPSPTDKRPRNRTLILRGWALAEEPLDGVEVTIPGLATETVSIGVPRPDVKHKLPDLDKNGKSGFSATIDTHSLPNGRHTAHLRLIGNGQVLQETETEFLIDHTVGYASDYEEWIAEFEAPANELITLKSSRFSYRPLVSILMPVFNTRPEELSAAINSVIAQSYSNWELCIADDGSMRPEIKKILSECANRHPNIKVSYLEQRRGIAAALNTTLGLASGAYVALLDHDDTLSPHALAYLIEALDRHPTADLFYSDEDKLDERGERYQPFFKPDWSPDLILSTNYVCHFLVVRRDLVEKVGEFCSETDGSQDYDYILRASEHAKEIVHIPHVLYHWRAGPNSTASSVESKPYTIEASRRALTRYCQRTRSYASVEPATLPGAWRLRYPIAEHNRVSIIIASGGNVEILRTNLEGLFARTEYKNFEAVVIDNSRDDHIEKLVEAFAAAAQQVRYIDWRHKSFNYSEINNAAARECEAPFLLFLNDDVSVINSDWLTSMVELISRPEVGAVGGKLLFPNGSIQHAGVVMGLFDNCGHAFYGLDGGIPHYFGFTDLIRNVSAVTGACLMTKADVFWQAGGFDELRLAVAFNDVDLCLKIGALGYRVLFTPFAQLYHHESFSKTQKDLIPHPTEVAVMQSKWREVIAADPFYSPNLTRRQADYSLPTLWN